MGVREITRGSGTASGDVNVARWPAIRSGGVRAAGGMAGGALGGRASVAPRAAAVPPRQTPRHTRRSMPALGARCRRARPRASRAPAPPTAARPPGPCAPTHANSRVPTPYAGM
ncbi:unnamed protein product, partial [Iphiclides podalirius]